MILRSITNISESELLIRVNKMTSINLKPNESAKNINVENLEMVKPFVSVEYDLSEIIPIKEGRQNLYD